MPSLNEPDTEMKDAALAYLRNINTRPGPGAGRSIDPTKPGPDADRIIAKLERDLERAKDIKFEPDRHRRIDELCAELSRLRNEQPRDKTDAWDREHAKSRVIIQDENGRFEAIDKRAPPGLQDGREVIIAAIKTHVLCDYHAGIRDAEAAADEILAALAQSDAQPVGWQWRDTHGNWTDCHENEAKWRMAHYEVRPLYTAPPRPDASGLMKAAELPLDVLQSAGEYLCMDWDPATTTAVEAVSVIWNIITNALRSRAADRSGK